ncbi:MATE family efflux transporter [Acidaminobacter sp. JC074]|uniref:MATE family efflux transporter n=1 Tax=Acidaminobacter sp. JC074 TaxID=2530199 RepID=UPI001F0D53AD|nr:MATE family efflux transporter [Acidaminobacter sp. JC074]MCH4889216.1 MATE family efflux transporter [Acidaminobacter sp. JC074]
MVLDKKLLNLAWPIFIELLLLMLLGNVDQIMISRYSQNAVAAVGNANQIIGLLTLFFSILSTASVILITQYKGAGREGELNKIYSLAVIVNLVISGIISLILWFFNIKILNALSVPAEVIPDASKYMVLTGSFMFLQAMMITFSSFLKSNHLTKQSMKVSVITNITNIFGNLILINGIGFIPALGVTGIAISTSVSRWIGVVLMIMMYRKHIGDKISLSVLNPLPKVLIRNTIKVGLASAGFSFSYNLSQIVILSVINLFGTTTINAKIYTSILVTFTYLSTLAISNASQIIVGNKVGAGDYDEAEQRTWVALRWSMLTCLIMSLITYSMSDNLFRIFTADPEIIRLGKTILLIDILLEQGRAGNICLLQSLQVANDNKYLFKITVISTWAIAVIGGYVLAVVFDMGLVGIWIAMTADEILRAVLSAIRWKNGKWKEHRLVEKMEVKAA